MATKPLEIVDLKSPFSSLPREILDHIFAFAFSPKETRYWIEGYNLPPPIHLSLVCRSWAAMTRPLVFQSLKTPPGGQLNELNHLPALLLRDDGRLGQYVRCFNYEALGWLPDKFFEAMPHLHTLKVSIGFDPLPSKDPGFVSFGLQSVKHLHLSFFNCVWDRNARSSHNFWFDLCEHYIAGTPNIDTLTLQIDKLDYLPRLAITRLELPCLTRLALIGHAPLSLAFRDEDFDLYTLRNVSHLTFDTVDPATDRSPLKLLARIGPQIKTLALLGQMGTQGRPTLPAILASCTGVEKLLISTTYLSSPTTHWIYQGVAELPPKLRTIDIRSGTKPEHQDRSKHIKTLTHGEDCEKIQPNPALETIISDAPITTKLYRQLMDNSVEFRMSGGGDPIEPPVLPHTGPCDDSYENYTWDDY